MPIVIADELKDKLTDAATVAASVKDTMAEQDKKLARYQKLDDYYQGKHAILKRQMRPGLPNHKNVHNFAKYITVMATGYLIGKPVTYHIPDESGLDVLLEQYQRADIAYIDTELAKDCSVFGLGHELIYTDETGKPKSAVIDPRNSYLCVSDDIEKSPIMGVYYYLVAGREKIYMVNAYTDTYSFVFSSKDKRNFELVSQEPHYFDAVPMVEYQNDEEMQGDFEQVITLIDAYNLLSSDRLNGREQDIDSILAIYGMQAPNENEIKALKDDKILALPADARAEWLTKLLSEEGHETARKALSEDIHKFAFVPDMTDREFAGNASGVAMRYKVIAFEQMTATKERFFKKGLRLRMELYGRILGLHGNREFDTDLIDIKFVRNLPVNESEIAEMVSTLAGMVSQRTLLTQIPFVENVNAELEGAAQERQERLQLESQLLGGYPGDIIAGRV